MLERIPEEEILYESVDTIVSEDETDQNAFPEELLNILTPSGMPPHKLRLKAGAVIMLLRNLVTSKGVCNGTRLTVTRLQRNITEARVIDLHYSGTILIPKILLNPSDTDMTFKFQRRQFPVRLTFL